MEPGCGAGWGRGAQEGSPGSEGMGLRQDGGELVMVTPAERGRRHVGTAGDRGALPRKGSRGVGSAWWLPRKGSRGVGSAWGLRWPCRWCPAGGRTDRAGLEGWPLRVPGAGPGWPLRAGLQSRPRQEDGGREEVHGPLSAVPEALPSRPLLTLLGRRQETLSWPGLSASGSWVTVQCRDNTCSAVQTERQFCRKPADGAISTQNGVSCR